MTSCSCSPILHDVPCPAIDPRRVVVQLMAREGTWRHATTARGAQRVRGTPEGSQHRAARDTRQILCRGPGCRDMGTGVRPKTCSASRRLRGSPKGSNHPGRPGPDTEQGGSILHVLLIFRSGWKRLPPPYLPPECLLDTGCLLEPHRRRRISLGVPRPDRMLSRLVA
jgi:hypothetical protein